MRVVQTDATVESVGYDRALDRDRPLRLELVPTPPGCPVSLPRAESARVRSLLGSSHMTRRVAADARGDDVVGVGTFPEMPRATAGEKPRPTASASPEYFAPPSANKVVWYRAWFGAILFLEYALVRKSVTVLKLLSHPWVSIAVHVAIDAVVLWFLNAFPGVPNTGLARQSEKDAARGERRRRETSRADAASNADRTPRRLRVPQSAPLLVRHALKLFIRVPTISNVLLGTPMGLYHGYTQKQVLLMVLSPTFFNTAFGGWNSAYLTAQSAINGAFVLTVTYLNPGAYSSYPELRRLFLDAMGDPSRYFTVCLPIVVAAPFAFAFLLQRDALVTGLEFWWRVYFGEHATLGEETGLEPTPWMLRRVVGRLKRTSKRVIPLAALWLCVGTAARARLTYGFDDAFHSYDDAFHSIACIALSVACLVASVTVPGKLADAFSASPREFNENVRNGAEKAAFKGAASYAATSALACAVVTRGNVLGIPTHAITSIAVHAWLPAWGIVVACTCAVTPSPGVPRAARAAAAAVAVAVAGLVVIDPRAIEYVATMAREQTGNCAIALLLAYLCALHAASAWSIHARMLFEDSAGAIDEKIQEMLWVEATKSGLPRARKGHWQPEDFEIDPSRFEVRPRDRHLSLDDARYEFVPLARDSRGGTEREDAFESLCEPQAPARGVSLCRAEGCGKPVKSGDMLAEGLNLCAEHMVAEEPFQCQLRGGAAHFCVLCRRVHSPPRCFDTAEDSARFPNSRLVPIDEIGARASDATSGLRKRSRTRRERSVSMRAWYKTKEGPVEATARMRDVVADIAALRPGNVRMLHAEVTARPGCTLLTVDVGALMDEDAGSVAGSDRDDETDETDDETGSERARDEEIARALLDAGVRHSLDGVLDFEITNGAPSEVTARRTFRRFAFDSRKRASSALELDAEAHFARFARFGFFGAENAARGDDEEGSIDSVGKGTLRLLRSDRYDFLTVPTAPEGYVYVLRCGGTYLPLISPNVQEDDENCAATCMLHAPPSDAEGLGFIELIALQDLEAHDIDLDDGPADVAGRVDISPLLATAVFITPDAGLAAELGNPVTGARAEHAPMLFNIGAALTGRASGAVVGDSGSNENSRSHGDLDDSETVREEAIFHATCGAASMGWSVATARIIANLHVQRIGREGTGLNRDDHAAWMSENPDTATDEYSLSSEYSSDGAGRRVSRVVANARGSQTLGTLAGAATLMRAAYSSGDASTSQAVTAWVVRNYGVVVTGDLLSAGDGGGVGNDWTPLHAAAFAVARRVQESVARESWLECSLGTVEMLTRGALRSVSTDAFAAVDTVIKSLAISGDPLSWARNSAASAAAPSAVLRNKNDADDTGSTATFSRVAAWRAGRERVALDEQILQTLSVATRDAVDILRRTTPPEKPRLFGLQALHPVDEHFTAAAAFAAFACDGSQASTMTVAMLTPASSKSWDALRARALDDTRGDVSSEEAMDWLRAGAPSDGFPAPSAEEIMARDVGVEASIFFTAMDATMMSLVIWPVISRELGYGVLSPLGPRAVAALSQWLAPAACACARATATPSKRLGSERRATNERVRLVGAGAQTLATYFTRRHLRHLLIGRGEHLPAIGDRLSFATVLMVRCALVFAQAVAAPCGSLTKETTCVLFGALACAALVADVGDIVLSESIPSVSFSFCVVLIASTLVARCARWCVPRVARTRVDKLAAERMAASLGGGAAKKTR